MFSQTHQKHPVFPPHRKSRSTGKKYILNHSQASALSQPCTTSHIWVIDIRFIRLINGQVAANSNSLIRQPRDDDTRFLPLHHRRALVNAALAPNNNLRKLGRTPTPVHSRARPRILPGRCRRYTCLALVLRRLSSAPPSAAP